MKKIGTIFILYLFILHPWSAAYGDGLSLAGAQLHQWFSPVSQNDPEPGVDPRMNPAAALARFYQRRNFKPAWIGSSGPLPQLDVLLQTIRHATSDGLRLMDYDFWDFKSDTGRQALFSDDPMRLNDQDLASLDVALSEAMLRYAAHLTAGRVRPEELPSSLSSNEILPTKDLPTELAEALDSNRLESFIAALSPRHRQYRALKKNLQRYRQIQAQGGWPRISDGAKLKIGETGPRVTALYHHLTITGDLQADPWLPRDLFSAPLEAAVKRFQYRHGLEVDGIVGSRTLTTLNIPIESRIIQLMLNMERWRWLPEDFGTRYVIVNIPAFELRLVENRTTTLSMRVIVGRKKRPTPVLTSRMTYLEVNPYWNVPQKIARKDLLPKIQADPEYLTRQRIQVFDSWQEEAPELDPMDIDWANLSEKHFPFRLRQEPAARNALGRIKFMFPNPLSVYIHDTPGKSLFNQPQRLFSSGCVRVEDPLALAVQLLKDQHYDRRRLAKTINSDQNRTIVLRKPIPVYLVYFTAWTDNGNDIHFSDDIYDHDRQLLVSLLKNADNYGLCSSATAPGRTAKSCTRPGL